MSNPERFVILLGGPLHVTPRVKRHVQGRRVIAADAGAQHAQALGLEPELWVGDFDSAAEDLKRRLAHVPQQPHPVEKDMTDGAIAVAEALRRGGRDLLLLGAMEGRTDHALSHLLMLADLAEAGHRAMASSGREEAVGIAPGRHVISLPAGATFSLIGFSPLRGVHLTGARWSLRGDDLPFASTRPLSNVAEGPIELTIGEGRGVLIADLRSLSETD